MTWASEAEAAAYEQIEREEPKEVSEDDFLRQTIERSAMPGAQHRVRYGKVKRVK